jgi:hypothetical protein
VETPYGHQFYLSVFAPIQAMLELMNRKDIAGALAAVHHPRLAEAFDRGVDAVARDSGAPRRAVLRLLPAAEALAAAEASGQCQQRAVEVWELHEGHLSRLLVGGVGLLADSKLGGFGLGSLLSSRLGDFIRNTRLAGPLKDLDAALRAYDEVLKRCVAILDADTSLRATVPGGIRRMIVWGVVALAAGCAITAIATVVWIRPSNATITGTPPAAIVSVPSATPAPASVTLPLPSASASSNLVTHAVPRPTARPAFTAPASRATCLRACVTACNDDSNCERSCATNCPP